MQSFGDDFPIVPPKVPAKARPMLPQPVGMVQPKEWFSPPPDTAISIFQHAALARSRSHSPYSGKSSGKGGKGEMGGKDTKCCNGGKVDKGVKDSKGCNDGGKGDKGGKDSKGCNDGKGDKGDEGGKDSNDVPLASRRRPVCVSKAVAAASWIAGLEASLAKAQAEILEQAVEIAELKALFATSQSRVIEQTDFVRTLIQELNEIREEKCKLENRQRAKLEALKALLEHEHD